MERNPLAVTRESNWLNCVNKALAGIKQTTLLIMTKANNGIPNNTRANIGSRYLAIDNALET
jgi:hypothetical protein